MNRSSLTPKQERFVEEYLVDLNATRAAIRAGYSQRNADKIGPELLGKTRIAAAIVAKRERVSLKAEVSAAEVLRELAVIAFSDVGEVMDFSGVALRLKAANEIPERARRALSSVKVKRYLEGHGDDVREVEVTEFKFWPKTQALELLGKHLALFATAEGAAPEALTALLALLSRRTAVVVPSRPRQIEYDA